MSSAVSIGKIFLARAGTRMPASFVNIFRLASGYMSVGHWVRSHGWQHAPRVSDRYRVFQVMLDVVGSESVTYLEFGVANGTSLRWWSGNLSNQGCDLHAFDSFLGLPETFDFKYSRGHFDRGGVPPSINDPRVTFHVGWFQETLPSFRLQRPGKLVIVLDADLYSSTMFVLDELDHQIKTGTLIYFDDLSRPDHEPAAFDDYLEKSGKTFEPLAFEENLNTGAFICTKA